MTVFNYSANLLKEEPLFSDEEDSEGNNADEDEGGKFCDQDNTKSDALLDIDQILSFQFSQEPIRHYPGRSSISKIFNFVLILHLILRKVTKFRVKKFSSSEVISQNFMIVDKAEINAPGSFWISNQY